MNHTLRSTWLAAALLCAGTAALAQAPAPDAMTPPPPPASAIAAPARVPQADAPRPALRAPGPRRGPPTPEARAAESVVTGQLQRWLVNPNGEADGLLLSDGTQVSFPPHLSQEALAAFHPGERIEVRGFKAPDVPVMRAASLRAPASGRSIADNGPPPPRADRPAPRDTSALTAMSASGRIERVLYTDRGEPAACCWTAAASCAFRRTWASAWRSNSRPASRSPPVAGAVARRRAMRSKRPASVIRPKRCATCSPRLADRCRRSARVRPARWVASARPIPEPRRCHRRHPRPDADAGTRQRLARAGRPA